MIYRRVVRSPTGFFALVILLIFGILGVYAPLFAANVPLVAIYDGHLYFPIVDLLFYTGAYTKKTDIFFNLAMFTIPWLLWRRTRILACAVQIGFFLYLIVHPVRDPLYNEESRGQKSFSTDWNQALSHFSPQEKRAYLFEDMRLKRQYQRISLYLSEEDRALTPYEMAEKQARSYFANALARQEWLEREAKKVSFIQWPFFREFHWEDDSGMGSRLSKSLPFWEIARPNQKDLVASLLFGIRIAFVVGIVSEVMILLIAIPLGSWSGYSGGIVDLIVLRLIEVWESMPLFFMLLFLVSIMETKSIFQVIFAIGLFGWTSTVRYLRAEIFREKGLPYVDAARLFGFSNFYIVRRHILPNAIIPLLALIPFSMLVAISSEAGLSFLGLGEENSASWGVMMDEARQFFPSGIDLMWPPALCLTLLLVAIALLGDALRDAIDPKKGY